MLTKNCTTGWILALAIGMFVTMPALGQIIYVDADTTDANDGSSWANAYNDLQDALAVATYGDEIRVAQGVYYPSVLTDPCDPRSAMFQLINGVALKGGYAGLSEQDPSARNVELYETILSGDIGTTGEPNDNCYHVFYHPDGLAIDPNAILDGFTITGGNANGDNPHNMGGGMYNDNSSPTVTNCTFTGNSALSKGGGMSNRHGSSPTVTNCTFSGNSVGQGGGGMANWYSSPAVTNCTFIGNSADRGSSGGMDNDNSSPTVTDCTFTNNSASWSGGGMSNYRSVLDPTVSRTPKVSNCIFTGNSADHKGGGMYNLYSSPEVTNCTFTANTAHEGGGIYNNYVSSNSALTNSTFSGNLGKYRGGGMYNNSSSPTVTDCTFSSNIAGSGGGLFSQVSGGQIYPPLGNDYIAIAAGGVHNLALKADGSIVGWGSDYYGQATPPDGNDYVAIAAGSSYSVALKTDGSIVGWGWGDGDGLFSDIPTENGYVAIDAGYHRHNLALKADDSIVGWGDNQDGQCDVPLPNKDFARIAAGSHHSLALKKGGYIVGWGDNGWDQATPPDGNDFVAIAAGGLHNLALKADRSIVGWGYDSLGQASPPDGNDYIAIAAEDSYSLALKADGSIVGWGNNDSGQASPSDGNDYVAIAAGYSHGLALKTDGSIVSWPKFYLTLTNCTISGNIPDGIWMEYSEAVIEGIVEIASNDWIGNDVMFTGDGELQIDPNSTLDLDNSRISCDLFGMGTVRVDAGTELIIEGDSFVNLGGSSECNPDPNTGGHIIVEGALVVRDNATLMNSDVDVKLLDIEGANDIQYNNITLLEASTGFGGEFFAGGTATINCNTIVSEGDRYLDLDPDPESAEHPTITDNQITVIIKEGVSGSQGTLLELRARDYDCGEPNNPDCESGAYQVHPNSPGFTEDPSENWVLEKLILESNAKLNLTNRQGFEFQDLNDPNWETVYVKELVLGPNSVLNTAFQTLYYQRLVDQNGVELVRDSNDPYAPLANGSRFQDIPVLGFSLGIIAMDDLTAPPHNEFDIRVRRRIRDPQDIQPDSCMDGSNPNSCLEGSIERIDDDPNIPVDAGGVMDMRTRALGKQSASSVAAKGAFARAGDEDITIEFEYMFIEDPCNEAEMIVYLSDEPEVGRNLVEVARVRPPAPGRPGSISNGKFAVFSGTFSRW